MGVVGKGRLSYPTLEHPAGFLFFAPNGSSLLRKSRLLGIKGCRIHEWLSQALPGAPGKGTQEGAKVLHRPLQVHTFEVCPPVSAWYGGLYQTTAVRRDPSSISNALCSYT